MSSTVPLTPKRYDFEKGYRLQITEVESSSGEYVRYNDYLKLKERASLYMGKYYDTQEAGQRTFQALTEAHADLEQARVANGRLLTELDALKARGFWAKFQDLIPG